MGARGGPERHTKGLPSRANNFANIDSDNVTDTGADSAADGRAYSRADHHTVARIVRDAVIDADSPADYRTDADTGAEPDDVDPNDGADSPANRLALHGRQRQFRRDGHRLRRRLSAVWLVQAMRDWLRLREWVLRRG